MLWPLLLAPLFAEERRLPVEDVSLIMSSGRNESPKRCAAFGDTLLVAVCMLLSRGEE